MEVEGIQEAKEVAKNDPAVLEEKFEYVALGAFRRVVHKEKVNLKRSLLSKK